MRKMLSVVAALVLAGIGAVAVVLYAGAADARALAGQEATTVYVTARTVPAGTTLGEAVGSGLLEKAVFAARTVPAGALTTVDGPDESLVATSQIAPGEIVLERRFGAQVAGTAALVVPEGQMAVTVQLSDRGRVGPFLRPGSLVALYDTYAVRDAGAGDLSPRGTGLGDDVNATRVVLPEATVLAVGDLTLGDGEQDPLTEDSDVPTTLVTLAVEAGDAARLVHAAQTGQLYAALLGAGADPGNPLVDDRTLFGGPG